MSLICVASDVPKFLAQDVPLFQAIVSDLFPGVTLPEHDYGELKLALERDLASQGLKPVPKFLTKVIQLFETLNVRHGVMLVGPTGGGKTVCRSTLAAAMTHLREDLNSPNQVFQIVRKFELNPKVLHALVLIPLALTRSPCRVLPMANCTVHTTC